VSTSYSFDDSKVTIDGPGGSFLLGTGPTESITICDSDTYESTSGADGSIEHIHKAGPTYITVKLVRASPVNALLSQLHRVNRQSSANWSRNTIKIVRHGQDVTTCEGLAFADYDRPSSDHGEQIWWEFIGSRDACCGR
jgi:Bacteriophage KPP10, Structural protein ORF10